MNLGILENWNYSKKIHMVGFYTFSKRSNQGAIMCKRNQKKKPDDVIELIM